MGLVITGNTNTTTGVVIKYPNCRVYIVDELPTITIADDNVGEVRNAIYVLVKANSADCGVYRALLNRDNTFTWDKQEDGYMDDFTVYYTVNDE